MVGGTLRGLTLLERAGGGITMPIHMKWKARPWELQIVTVVDFDLI